MKFGPKLILEFCGYLETLVLNFMGLHFWLYALD
jgi:hypothetical protein